MPLGGVECMHGGYRVYQHLQCSLRQSYWNFCFLSFDGYQWADLGIEVEGS